MHHVEQHHVPNRLVGFVLFVTAVLPASAVGGLGADRFGWAAVAVFLIMAGVTILTARILLVYMADSYVAAVVKKVAQAYITVFYLVVFAALAYWLYLLGVGSGFAVVFSGGLAVGVLVAYLRWLKPWLTKRNLRPLSFLDD
jgi:hypothetical protein